MCEVVQDGTYLWSWIIEFDERCCSRDLNSRENMVTVRIRSHIDCHFNAAIKNGLQMQ